MSTRSFATAFGIVFLLVGIAGFVPQLVTSGAEVHPLSVDTDHDMLFGLFPISPLHNVVHLLFGAWGVYAGRGAGQAVRYARAVAIAYALLTFAGFVPGLSDGFGLLPLYGNDIWLHGLLALIAAYFGWVHRTPA